METLLRASVVRLSEGAPLLLQRLVVPIGDVQTECAPWAEQVPYTDLYSLPFCSQVNLFFATPTAFAQSHLPDLPLPLPEKLVQSWFQRWNTFAPASLRFPEALCGSLSARVALSQCAISTEVVHRRKSLQIGFVGEVYLRAYEKPSAPWSEEERRCFAALVAYSRFCGTGLGTTQGFGLTMPWEAQKRILFREARRKEDA
jgi:CRISPR/Cas system endoribonuclease Cas6 (RAMP superfamily)